MRNGFRLYASALAFLLLLAAFPSAAAAYIGPGSGIGALGSILSLIGAFFLLIVGFVWYPVKRLLRALRRPRGARNTTEGGRAEGA